MHLKQIYQMTGLDFFLVEINSCFFQDPVHIVTKWHNRLLSSTADLFIGNDKISMAHMEQLINSNSYTKLDHGLTKSDISPKDRQNYNS